MKSRCQKGFQRLSEKKNLRKTALLSLTLPELLQPPSKHDIHVLYFAFIWEHGPWELRHVLSREPLPSSREFPGVRLAAKSQLF